MAACSGHEGLTSSCPEEGQETENDQGEGREQRIFYNIPPGGDPEEITKVVAPFDSILVPILTELIVAQYVTVYRCKR